ncbi:unnamed protein product [Rotaria sp. Silwood1]|nr:unnamed protein product [Rotaria sp. Silwood1]CAF1520283.1 unnamed protein product [Rotaria sp. Silwood1]
MKYSCSQLNDLPDEIILKNLFNVEVLYSLIGINNRFNTIAHDSIFTSRLTLTRDFLNDSTYPLSDSMLDEFCSQILPEIHHKNKWLNLESSYMKWILLATNYPNISELGFYNINIDKVLSPFTATEDERTD